MSRECDQTRCAFHSQVPILCPRCAECQTAPHQINEDCPNCWNCLKDENFIRDGVPDGNEVYRDLEYVKEECRKIADQLDPEEIVLRGI